MAKLPLSASDLESLICAHTAISSTQLVPEVRLLLATEVTPLWEATEAWLKENGVPPPFWAFAWPGGQAIARHVLDRPEVVKSLRVLDFASGSGLVAIAAAMAGAAQVVAADIDPFAVAAIRLNATLNGVGIEVTASDLLENPAQSFDVILAGDTCYEAPMASRVESWLRARSQAGVSVLLGDPGRSYLPQHGLEEVARYGVATNREVEARELVPTTVWRVIA